ncbi:MAG: MmcQ/YjbR family DNA-binding protein [Caldilineaceae bacterium]
MSAIATAAAAMQTELLTFALTLPEAYEDRPWGETVVKVRNKIFVFLGGPPDAVAFTLKLPRSHGYALSLPYAKPAGYGLGKSGWVSCQTTIVTAIEVPLVKEWIVESYRAVAPKKLAALIDQGGESHALR